MISMSVDTKPLQKIDKELSKFPNEIPRAKAAAVKRVLAMIKTEAKRQATGEYTIKSTDFASHVQVKNDHVLVESRLLTLHHFKVKSDKSGVLVQIRKDSPAGPIKGTEVPGIRKQYVKARVAFRGGTGASGDGKVQSIVFMRTGRARLPIKAIRTLSAAQMITRDDVAENITKYASEQLNKRVTHEVNRRLERMAKRASK